MKLEPHKKVFRGSKKQNKVIITINNKKFSPIFSNGLGLPKKFDFGNDSPESRQLAYSLLAYVFDIDIANKLYIEFVDDVIKYMPNTWTLPESAIKSEAKKIANRIGIIK